MQISRVLSYGRLLPALALLVALCGTGVATADLSGAAFRIDASNDQGTASWEVPLSDLTYDSGKNSWSWSRTLPKDLENGEGDIIATLTQANVYILGDPQINLGFAVQAGSTDTTFTITTALVSFLTINSAQGAAGAAFTITDASSPYDGAAFTAGNGTGHGYWARYNGTNDFTRLVKDFSAGAGKSASVAENDPLSGTRAVGGNVSDMSIQIQFKLSKYDVASGTNSYLIIPEPSALALLALGGLTLLRRRT